MQLVYAGEAFPETMEKSIFLAGPTPRSKDVTSWRPEAIEILRKQGYDGLVFIPESREGNARPDYNNQITWEDQGLNRADCILFWIPRDLKTLPGFTTNHEHGEWFKSGKIVLGAPSGAPNMNYLFYKAKEWFVPQADNLSDLVGLAIKMIGNGALRNGGECQVPLHIWNTPSFQQWYQNLKKAGNVLCGAKVEWTFRVGPTKNFVFFWVLRVDIYITKEGRHKTNEVILARPDISTVVMYKKEPVLKDSTIVLIREFRSPVSNDDGYVREVAGGSSFKPKGNILQIAADELHEETDLKIDAGRIKVHQSRQMVATFSAHQAHVFSVEITDDELCWLRDQVGVPHGVIEDTERTYTEIYTFGEILDGKFVDWSMLGIISSVLLST